MLRLRRVCVTLSLGTLLASALGCAQRAPAAPSTTLPASAALEHDVFVRRPAPTSIPAFCGPVWDGIVVRDGKAGFEQGGFVPLERLSVDDARDVLLRAARFEPDWSSWGPGERTEAFHRLREAPDAVAQLEALTRSARRGAGVLYGLCGLAELDAPRYLRARAHAVRSPAPMHRTSHTDIVIQTPVRDTLRALDLVRLYRTPGGLVVPYGSTIPPERLRRVQIVHSIYPFDPTGDRSLAQMAYPRVVAAIDYDSRVATWLHTAAGRGGEWWASVEVNEGDLLVALQAQRSPGTALVFRIEDADGSVWNVQESSW